MKYWARIKNEEILFELIWKNLKYIKEKKFKVQVSVHRIICEKKREENTVVHKCMS